MKLEPFSREWIDWQAGLRRSDPYFLSKIKLVKDFAEYLHDRGERITYQRVRAMLSAMDRDYGLSRQEIHWGIYLSKVGVSCRSGRTESGCASTARCTKASGPPPRDSIADSLP